MKKTRHSLYICTNIFNNNKIKIAKYIEELIYDHTYLNLNRKILNRCH